MFDGLAAVVGLQVAVAAGHGGGQAEGAAGLLVEESGEEEWVAAEVERVDQLGQPRVLGERLGWEGWLGYGRSQLAGRADR